MFEEFEIVTKSDTEAEKFKYNKEMKKEVFNKIIKNPFLFPVIVYVKNPDIPDLKKILYLVHRTIDIDGLLDIVKNYLEYEKEGIEYGLRSESEPDGFICGDLMLEEAHEYFSNRDFFLYLILDEKK